MNSDEMIEAIKIRVQKYLESLKGYNYISSICLPIEDIKKYSSMYNKYGAFINKVFVDGVEIAIFITPIKSRSLKINYSRLEEEDLKNLYKKLFK